MPRRGSGSPYDHSWQKVRLTILERDGHLCQIKLPRCTGAATHVDHIVPLSEGGARLAASNCRASCAYCNLARNALRVKQITGALVGRVEAAPSREW